MPTTDCFKPITHYVIQMSRRQQIEEMLKSDPEDVFLNYALAKEMVSEGDTDAALAQFDRVMALDANYVPAYFQKGQVFVERGEIDSARDVLTTGIGIAQRVGDDHAAREMAEFLDSL